MSNRRDMHNAGVHFGIIFAMALLSLVLASMILGVGEPIIVLLGSLYKGYAATFLGAITGLILGFIHGYVVGVLVTFAKRYLPKI